MEEYMKYTKEEFFRIVGKQQEAIIKLADDMTERSKRKETLSEGAEAFAEFVNQFPDDEKTAAYAILVMIGINIGSRDALKGDFIVLSKPDQKN
jgi:hypothetical protein